jgi:hypothetical protein
VDIRREAIAGLVAFISLAMILASCTHQSSSGTKAPTVAPNCPTSTGLTDGASKASLSQSQHTFAIASSATDCAGTATPDPQALIKANNDKAIAAITAWETDFQKMLVTQNAKISQFTNETRGSPRGRPEAPIGVAEVWDLKNPSARIDGNGNTLTAGNIKTGYIGRATLAQLIRNGDQRTGFIFLYGIDLGHLTTPDGYKLFAQGYLIGGKPVAVLWNQHPDHCLETCGASLSPTGSFDNLQTGSNTEVDPSTYVPLGIG